MPLLFLREFWFVEKVILCPQNLVTQLRGGNHVIDNDEVLDRRMVSWMGLEGTDASSAVAT
ncbi:hypothetical protein A2U01_0074454, partial [Trifolium medium]|nr:hypothetical protein [Trifolium medium]